MLKKSVFAALVLTMLLSFCTVFADQDGNSCWCNIDDYGCWNTGEDGGKSYIMFWSEESRQYIMGTGSAPYKFVVEKPGSSNILRMQCGSPAPVIIPTAAPGAAAPDTPAYDCSNFTISDCAQGCKRLYWSCVYSYCEMKDAECIKSINLGTQCNPQTTECLNQCDVQESYCKNQ